MIRKLLLVAAATAMPIGIIAATGSVASAKAPPPVNVTTNTATCTGISGSVKFNPPISQNQTVGATETITVKAKVSDCTSNYSGLTVKDGTVTGTFTSPITSMSGCAALFGNTNVTGSLSTKWTTTPKLSSGNSDVTVNSVQGGVAPDGTNAEFEIPGTTPDSATGSFSGTDNGASGSTAAQSKQTTAALGKDCDGKGIKSLTLAPVSGTGAPTAAFYG
jgi:hypothetical protein